MTKTALILEGGGMRCVYTAGLIDTFIENGFEFDACCAVSAGAYHAPNLLSRQSGRAFRACTEYLSDKRYFSLRNKLTTGDMFGEKFVYHDIPENLIPFDYEAFKKSPTELYAVVTSLETGRAEYIRVKDLKRDADVIRASSSLPFVSKIVKINGKKYLDGGIADSIPVRHMLEESDRAVVVLSQHKGFVKKQTTHLKQTKLLYARYPKFVEAMATRHIRYNEALKFIEEGAKCGRVFPIYPKKEVEVARLDKDMDKIYALYREGIADGKELTDKLREFLAN